MHILGLRVKYSIPISEETCSFMGLAERVEREREGPASRPEPVPIKEHVSERPHQLRTPNALSAAACCASCFDFPSPLATSSCRMYTPTIKRLS